MPIMMNMCELIISYVYIITLCISVWKQTCHNSTVIVLVLCVNIIMCLIYTCVQSLYLIIVPFISFEVRV